MDTFAPNGSNPASQPSAADVVIVGSGIIGVAAALFLAERGVSVVICEKGSIGCEQSSRNWGWVRKMGRDPIEIPLAIASVRLWEGMNQRLRSETGFRRTGAFYLCKASKDVKKYEAWLEHGKRFQLDSIMLTPQRISDYLPGLTGTWAGALFTPSDGVAEPVLAMVALAAAVRRSGGQIIEHCAVRGIETSAGRVSGVITERGEIRTAQVVLATGAWTRLFCGNMGINFPQLKVHGSVMQIAPIENAPSFAVNGHDFSFRKRLDGGYIVAQRNANIAQIVPDSFRLMRKFLPAFRSEGNDIRLRLGRPFFEELTIPRYWSPSERTPFEKCRILNPAPSHRILGEGLRNLVKSFPAFSTARIVKQWAGAIDVTPDALPVISAIENMPGLMIASGFSGHGFGIGPGAGHLIADLVTNCHPIVDPSPFKFSRLDNN